MSIQEACSVSSSKACGIPQVRHVVSPKKGTYPQSEARSISQGRHAVSPKRGSQYPPIEACSIPQARHAVSPNQGTRYPPIKACGIPLACLTKTSFICGSCPKSLSVVFQVLCSPSDSLSLPGSHCRLTLPKTVRSLVSQKFQERTTSKQVLPLAPGTSSLSAVFPCPSPSPT